MVKSLKEELLNLGIDYELFKPDTLMRYFYKNIQEKNVFSELVNDINLSIFENKGADNIPLNITGVLRNYLININNDRVKYYYKNKKYDKLITANVFIEILDSIIPRVWFIDDEIYKYQPTFALRNKNFIIRPCFVEDYSVQYTRYGLYSIDYVIGVINTISKFKKEYLTVDNDKACLRICKYFPYYDMYYTKYYFTHDFDLEIISSILYCTKTKYNNMCRYLKNKSNKYEHVLNTIYGKETIAKELGVSVPTLDKLIKKYENYPIHVNPLHFIIKEETSFHSGRYEYKLHKNYISICKKFIMNNRERRHKNETL